MGEKEKTKAELIDELAEMRQQAVEKDRLLAAYHQIGQIILSSLDLDEVLDSLTRGILEAGIFRSLMVALVDEDTHSVEVTTI